MTNHTRRDGVRRHLLLAAAALVAAASAVVGPSAAAAGDSDREVCEAAGGTWKETCTTRLYYLAPLPYAVIEVTECTATCSR